VTYQECVVWMLDRLPMYQQKGIKAYSSKLDGICSLAYYLDNPHDKFKSIHVGGTNGKGSSSHMLASILKEAGYKVGLYTSPHLKNFRERIQINGTLISEEAVTSFIINTKHFIEENHFSFFEVTVGMAFDYFANQEVDIAIIEVGLGGRLDSTNIITPEISLITNIGYDHTAILGNTLEKIAFEKAGIIKYRIPVVISEYQKETAPVFTAVATNRQAPIIFAENSINATYKTSLLGYYQIKNIKGVLGVLSSLKNFKVSEVNIQEGLLNVVENTGLMGRWQVLNKAPLTICDTAHNKEGLSIVMKQLLSQEADKIHIVLGVVKDKDLAAILPLFPKTATYYFCTLNISRGLPVEVLQETAKRYDLYGISFGDVNSAYCAAKQSSKKEDIIFIGGSTFVVAEVL